MIEKIDCTVGILTLNSGETLRRALESVRDFSQILICDGASTDNTRSIATQFGAEILEQDPQYLDGEGRIRDFSGVRNQCLAHARQKWFFFLDSDEYIDPELAGEINKIVQGNPAAYWVPRKYVYEGKIIDCSTGYPNQQIRLFHTDVTDGFIKTVHERIELREGAVVLRCTSPMFVPVSGDVQEARTKWSHYLSLENEREPTLSVSRGLYLSFRESAIGVRYFFRWLGLLGCTGNHMPMRNELLRVWYQAALVANIMRRIRL